MVQHHQQQRRSQSNPAGQLCPRLLQQLSGTLEGHATGPIANHGAGHDRQLGEEGRRQAERRFVFAIVSRHYKRVALIRGANDRNFHRTCLQVTCWRKSKPTKPPWASRRPRRVIWPRFWCRPARRTSRLASWCVSSLRTRPTLRRSRITKTPELRPRHRQQLPLRHRQPRLHR